MPTIDPTAKIAVSEPLWRTSHFPISKISAAPFSSNSRLEAFGYLIEKFFPDSNAVAIKFLNSLPSLGAVTIIPGNVCMNAKSKTP